MIYGERIRLRRIERADIPRYVEWLNDPEVRKGITVHLPISQVEEERWFERSQDAPLHERPFAVDIKTPQGWQHIGSTSLFDFDWRARRAEFGILIGDKSVWNQGYGTEITLLMLKHGFETFNLNKVYLKVYDHNRGARRAYEKAGYVLEGTLREEIYQNGQYYDAHMMSVLRSEWEARKEK